MSLHSGNYNWSFPGWYAVAVKRSLGADAAKATLAISVSFVGMYTYYLRYVWRQVDSKHAPGSI